MHISISRKIKLIVFSCVLFTRFLNGQCPDGNINLNSQVDVDNFDLNYPNCENISGNLVISGNINDLSSLIYIRSIEGSLIIQNTQLTSILNFNGLNIVKNHINISENQLLTKIEGFNAITDLGGNFVVENNPNLITISGFNNIKNLSGNFQINSNNLIETINGFDRHTTIGGFLGFVDNPLLVSIPNFNKLISISSSIQFQNTGLITISGFDNLISINGTDQDSGLFIVNNKELDAISGFNCLNNIANDLIIKDNPLLEHISGMNSLESVSHFFSLMNNNELSELYGFQNLAYVGTSGLENTVVFTLENNSQLSNCGSLCSLLASDGITGLVLISGNLTGCKSKDQITASNCPPSEIVSCTNLNSPVDGEINVGIDTPISWNSVSGATNYIISVGTTSEGTQLVNNLDVGNETSYTLNTSLPENTKIFVKVKPSNRRGQAQCCSEESFTTKTINLVCTELVSPFNNETNVSTDTSIIWNEVPDATGYLISLGTASGATNIANQIDVGKTTSFIPQENLPASTTFFVTITPYVSSIKMLDCQEERFTTRAKPIDCSNLLNPIDGDINVPVSTSLSWSKASEATSYILNIGTTPEGSEIVKNIDLGDNTNYDISENLPYGTLIYVSITPYNSSAQAENCIIESFTTEAIFIPKFFTPNNDGHNDTWLVKDPLNQIEVLYIFNRYGKLLKSINDLQNGWDGFVNKQALPIDDYWYVIKLKNGNQLNGHFTLKR